MPAVWLGGRTSSAVLLAVRKSIEEKFLSTVRRADAATTAAVASAEAPTHSPPRKPSSFRSPSHASRDEGRFAPGVLIAERYRIISLLGRGGMGEVFHADDLTLGQPVALKFLPESMIDRFMLERFRNEVRIARRISHPNVCRVYDIGETNNQVFLSMEYVDGEDLSSLLRRIGRFPRDKALEIARKICAGLAAAHDKGVLHRDLKPANIMLDGRGEVLIMDFGLAGLAHEIEDVRSGTPAYMAPEQLVGKEVTARSDIYALGLVLHELFTGKPAFPGKTRDEIVRVRRESALGRAARGERRAQRSDLRKPVLGEGEEASSGGASTDRDFTEPDEEREHLRHVAVGVPAG